MSDDQHEWGPWVEHDGKGCPCPGQIVEAVRRDGTTAGPWVAYTSGDSSHSGNPIWDSWVWGPKRFDIMRYRIRKPRGLTVLQSLLADLPDAIPGDVPAPAAPVHPKESEPA